MTLLQADPLPLSRDTSGVIRIGGTRISLDSLVTAYRNGATVQELVEGFPDLSLPDIHATIAYVLKHSEEVDHYLAERKRAARTVEARLREEFPEVCRRVRPERAP